MFQALADGTTITIETTAAPPLTIPLGAFTKDEPPGLVTRILRPRVTVRAPGGAVLYRVQPAGDPDQVPLGKALLVVAAVLVAAYLLK